MSDADQQLIAYLVAMTVVDAFESVQIEETDGAAVSAAFGVQYGLLQTIGEQTAVGDAGQGIVVGDPVQLGLMLLELGDIGKDTYIVLDLLLGIAYHGDGEQLGIKFSILAAVPDLAAPEITLFDLLPHLFIKLGILLPGGEQIGVLAHRF